MDHGQKTLLCILRRLDRHFGNGDFGEIAADRFMKLGVDLTSVLYIALGRDEHTRHASAGHGRFEGLVSFGSPFPGKGDLQIMEREMGQVGWHLPKAAGTSATLSLSETS